MLVAQVQNRDVASAQEKDWGKAGAPIAHMQSQHMQVLLLLPSPRAVMWVVLQGIPVWKGAPSLHLSVPLSQDLCTVLHRLVDPPNFTGSMADSF